MDPTILAGIKGNEVAVKLGHHVHDHGVGHDPDHKLNPAADGEVSPIGYGLSSMLKPAFWGALTLAGFALLYTAVSAAFPSVPVSGAAATEAVSFLGALAKNSTALIVAGISGAIWGAGTGFYKGYTHATEHNALVQRGIEDVQTELGTSRQRAQEQALGMPIRRGTVMVGTSNSMTPIGIVMQTDEPAPAMAAPTNEPARPRPQWMQEILDRGPRSATAPEQTVALSSQNGR